MSRATEYAGDHAAFAAWLEELDKLVGGIAPLSLFDLGDTDLLSSYEAGMSPELALRETVAEGVRAEFGDGIGELFWELAQEVCDES